MRRIFVFLCVAILFLVGDLTHSQSVKPDWWDREVIVEGIKQPRDLYREDSYIIGRLIQSGLPVNYLKPPAEIDWIRDENTRGVRLPRRTTPFERLPSTEMTAGEVVRHFVRQTDYDVAFINGCVVLERPEAKAIYDKIECPPYAAQDISLPEIAKRYHDEWWREHNIMFSISSHPKSPSFTQRFDLSFEGGTLIEFLCTIVNAMNAASEEVMYCWETGGSTEEQKQIWVCSFPRSFFQEITKQPVKPGSLTLPTLENR